MARLRFGYFIAPFHRAGTNPTLALQRDLEFAEHLDALGIRRDLVRRAPLRGQRDHQLTRDLHRRSRRTGEKNPLRHRRHLALVPQPALGGRPADAARSPHPRSHHRRGGAGLAAQRFRDDRPHPTDTRELLETNLDIVVRLLAGETVTAQNPHPRTVRRAAATRAVLRRRHPAGGRGRRLTDGCTAGRQARHRPAVHRGNAGRRGLRRACLPLGHRRRAGRGFGTRVDRNDWTLVGPFHVAETEEQARADVRFGIEPWFRYFQKVAAFPQMTIPGDQVDEMINIINDAGAGVIGTPEQARAQVQRLWDSPAGSAACCRWATSGRTRRRRSGPPSCSPPRSCPTSRARRSRRWTPRARQRGADDLAQTQLQAIDHMTKKYQDELDAK